MQGETGASGEQGRDGAAPDGALPEAVRLTAADLGAPLGERATLVQFSSAFCRPCVATRRRLAEAADLVPGVAAADVDAESHLELVRRLGIEETPTVLVLDSGGTERVRARGVPARHAVLAALATAIGGPEQQM
ncbi:thioredoxin family protein [Nocardiopsis coralliicola]